MGMYTDFSGEIFLTDESVINYLNAQIKMDFDDADYPFGNFFDAKIEKNKLIINSFERNYEEDVETALAMLIKIDPKATGEVLSTYSDGTLEENPEIRERFILKDGKVYMSVLKEVKLIYGKEEVYAPDFDEDTVQEIKDNLKRFEGVEVCDVCKTKINLEEFDFTKRKYYEVIKEDLGFKVLCKKCYTKTKKPYAEEEKLKEEYETKINKIEECKAKLGKEQENDE